jgi:hypothetical protein
VSSILSILTDRLTIEGQFILTNKTVSKQHLTVQVGEVGPADCVCAPIIEGRDTVELMLAQAQRPDSIDTHIDGP